ncbi:MAG: hypothetical protein ACJATA_000766 [Sphingobacteriales bacterium]|jgi:hypothetical protein
MKNACQDCGAPISGRADKKFCGHHCRNHYHNDKYKITSGVVRKINRILTRNRSILERLNLKPKETFPLVQLQTEGFDLRYFTRKKEFPDGSEMFYCYDQAYKTIGNNQISLIRKE